MKEIDMIRKQSDMQYENQSKLQDESSQAQARMYAPQLKEQVAETQAAVIAQTNPAKALRIIIEGLKGNMMNEYGDFEKVGEQLMNEKGIARVASMLIPFINDPIRFGNIDRKEVRTIALQITDDLTEDIGLNWREYDIKDPSHKDIIIDSLMTIIFITLTRSEEGGEKQFLSKIVLESLGSMGGKHQSKKEGFSWGKLFKL